MSHSKDAEPLLQWLRDLVIQAVRHGHDDLTMRQFAILLTTYGTEELLTVRGLANMLCISRPTVSRALDRLCGDRLVRREIDLRDRRSVILRRTPNGAQRIEQLQNMMRRVTCVDFASARTQPAVEAAGAATGESKPGQEAAGLVTSADSQ